MLELTDICKLRTTVAQRYVELKIDFSGDILIDSEEGLKLTTPQPKSLELLKSIKPQARPISICHYKGCTYVGLYNKEVIRIDSDYQIHSPFITCPGPVESIAIYEDKIYTLSYLSPRIISVYDMEANKICQWTHADQSGGYCNMLTVMADQVLIPNSTKKTVSVYSLTGEFRKDIPHQIPMKGNIAMCALNPSSLIISDYSTSKVFRLDISTGEVMWTSTEVAEPLCVHCYGRRYVLVACNNQPKIYILDSNTGAVLQELPITPSNVRGLHISEDKLILSNYGSTKVLFYRLVK